MFKKICVVLSCLLVLSGTYLFSRTPIFNDYSSVFEVYLNSADSTAEFKTVNISEFKFLSGVRGESFKTDKDNFDLQDFLESFSANLVFTEQIEHGVSYFAFSKDIKYRTTLSNKPINLHVFIGENNVVVGSPIISGSF